MKVMIWRKVISRVLSFQTLHSILKEKSIFFNDFVWRNPTHKPLRTCMQFKFKCVSKFFIEKQLKNLKRNKSTGADDLPSSLLKDCSSEISNPLSYIILSLKQAVIPDDWNNTLIQIRFNYR